MFGSWRRALASVVSVVLVAGLLNLLYWQAWSVLSGYNQMQQQATTEPIRTLIARAIEGLGTPAPVDAKTGDVYFPPAKLYLPASNAGNDGFTPATYKYSWDAAERTLTVIDVMVRQQAVTKLYTVQGLERLFEQVPYAQACSRGVMVMPAGKTPEGWEREALPYRSPSSP